MLLADNLEKVISRPGSTFSIRSFRMSSFFKRNLLLLLLLSAWGSSRADLIEELRLLSQISHLPKYRTNSEVGQISSYDRTGNNDDGFSGKYSFIRKEKDGLVIADLKGTGVIQRIWTPTPTKDTIQFFFDGESKPRISMRFDDLFSGKVYPFVRPVVGNEVGGFYSYLPITYKKSCKILFKGERMMFIQIQYRQNPKDKKTQSFPLEFSSAEKAALADAVKLWGSYGKELIDFYHASRANIKVEEKSVMLNPGQEAKLFETNKGGRIIGIELTPLATLNKDFKDINLRAHWDGETVPGINSPLTDFFGYSFGKPAMRSLFVGVNNGKHYSYLPMPFDKSASLELEYLKQPGQEARPIQFVAKVYYLEEKRAADEGKLYVKWRREIRPEEGKPYQILKTSGRGHHVGTILQAQGFNPGMTLFFEGDDSTVVDGKMVMHGTGSEDYFNGGWYAMADRWDQGYNLPIHGALTYSVPLARTGGYRFYIGDKVSYEKDYLLTIEHGPEHNKLPVDYTSVAFYYSDRPPVENDAPSGDLLSIYTPSNLEYYPQLFNLKALGHHTNVAYTDWREDGKDRNYDVYHFSAKNGGLIKFDLEVPGPGKYKLYFSYFKTPAGGNFLVNQRQNPIKSFNTKGDKNVFVEKEFIGEMTVEEGTNTVSVYPDGNSPDQKFDFIVHRIFMEKSE